MPPALFKPVHRILFGLFLAQWFLIWTSLLSHQSSVSRMLCAEALLACAAANTLATLSRELPWQNVLAVSVLITLVCGASERLVVLASAPSARLVACGSTWTGLLVWLVAICNARGIGRLVLFRWRASRVYGLWLIGLTAFLVVLFGIGLRFFFAADLELSPASISWLNLLYWAMTAALSLVLATPWLIDKRPGQRVPPRQPMISWILLNFLFATAAWLTGSWPVTAIIVTTNAIILFVAIAH